MLIRGRYVITDPGQEDAVIEDGAVCIRGSEIIAVGEYGQLSRLYADEDKVGSKEHIVLPGLVNAHDHGRGLSAFQLGVADDYLEPWLISLLAQREVDPYLATAYASAQLIESGVTTVVHSFYEPNPARYETQLAGTVKAYEDSGLRAVLTLGILDESPISDICERLLPQLPLDLKALVSDFLGKRDQLSADDFFTIFEEWRKQYNDKESSRIKILLGPVSIHWCSDRLLRRIHHEAEASQTGIQAHAIETIYQREDALRKYGKTAIEHLAEIGLLGPLLSCAHCVWVTEGDIDLLAESDTLVIHNPSSNLRLRSGIAPVNMMLQRGVNIALGMDSNSLNDDGDMFQEMRLVVNLHRTPGVGSFGPTNAQVLKMATRNGARALMLKDDIGALEAGRKADLILVRFDKMCFPYVDPRQGIIDILLHRAKAQDVDTVIIDGEVAMQDRKLLTIDKDAIVAELRSHLARPRGRHEEELSDWTQRLRSHTTRFCQAATPEFPSPHYVYNGKEV
jgi:5-methylthioadenosine/S-adenosylhomocysteine deaminase